MSQTLDSRDLQERLDELTDKKELIESIQEELSEADDKTDTVEIIERLDEAKADFDEDEQKELAELESLSEEISEWHCGAILVHENYWVDYCKELCEDIGDIPKNLPAYIEKNINWEGVADDLFADYGQYTYQGETYFARNC